MVLVSGFSVDWWALGVLMFEMMAGRSPFDIITDNPDMNTEEYLFQGKNSKYTCYQRDLWLLWRQSQAQTEQAEHKLLNSDCQWNKCVYSNRLVLFAGVKGHHLHTALALTEASF